jgi:hypothetical protein
VTKSAPERKPLARFFLADLAPHRRCFRFRIARRQQQLRLVRLERLRWGGPDRERLSFALSTLLNSRAGRKTIRRSIAENSVFIGFP